MPLGRTGEQEATIRRYRLTEVLNPRAVRDAVDVLSSLLQSESETVRLEAARAVMDIAFRLDADAKDRAQAAERSLAARAEMQRLSEKFKLPSTVDVAAAESEDSEA